MGRTAKIEYEIIKEHILLNGQPFKFNYNTQYDAFNEVYRFMQIPGRSETDEKVLVYFDTRLNSWEYAASLELVQRSVISVYIFFFDRKIKYVIQLEDLEFTGDWLNEIPKD